MTEDSVPQTQALPAWVDIVRTAIEIGPKVAITAGAICYGLGLLIVSSHLATLGVYTTDFLRTEYVLAGAAFCVLTLCAAVATHYLIEFLTEAAGLWKQRKYFWSLVRFVLTFWASLFIFTRALALISTAGFASYLNWRMWLTLGIAVSSYLAARNTLRVFRQVWATTLVQADNRTRMSHWWDLVWNLIWLVANVSVYTESVYPHLFLQYGGGHTEAVFLIPTANGQRVGHIAGLPFLPDGSMGPVQLLLENEQGYTVATMGGGRAVSVARDLVEGVVRHEIRAKATGRGSVTLGPAAPPACPKISPQLPRIGPVAQPKIH